jgi:hypothetical protein
VWVTETCITHCPLSLSGFRKATFLRLVLSPSSGQSTNFLSVAHYTEIVRYLRSGFLNIPTPYSFPIVQNSEACSTHRRDDKSIQTLKQRDHLGYLGVDGRIIVKLILKVIGFKVWTRLIWLRILNLMKTEIT